jgi:hypothetical protein
MPRHASLTAAFVAALIALLPVSVAAQDYCADLRARLGASRGGEDAIMRQLAQARRAASYEGCGRGLFGGLFGRRSGYCDRIYADIARLERQLYSRDRRGPSRSEAASIRRQMEEAGCNQPRSNSARADNWGPYRTLCVRSCDGYYFPISASASRSDLETHAKACQAACPGQEVTLFYQRTGEDDPKSAVSLDGRNYSELPAAFSYRTVYDPSCSCTPEGGWAGIAARLHALTAGGGASVPVPTAKPVESEDPETLANRDGGFTPVPVGPAGLVATAEPEIRVVGPAFIYRW